jgi:plasmid stabilization system protein ParE
MKLVFTKAAQRDLDHIALQIAKDNVDAALRVVVRHSSIFIAAASG